LAAADRAGGVALPGRELGEELVEGGLRSWVGELFGHPSGKLRVLAGQVEPSVGDVQAGAEQGQLQREPGRHLAHQRLVQDRFGLLPAAHGPQGPGQVGAERVARQGQLEPELPQSGEALFEDLQPLVRASRIHAQHVAEVEIGPLDVVEVSGLLAEDERLPQGGDAGFRVAQLRQVAAQGVACSALLGNGTDGTRHRDGLLTQHAGGRELTLPHELGGVAGQHPGLAGGRGSLATRRDASS
jgi:hypothetical protein